MVTSKGLGCVSHLSRPVLHTPDCPSFPAFHALFAPSDPLASKSEIRSQSGLASSFLSMDSADRYTSTTLSIQKPRQDTVQRHLKTRSFGAKIPRMGRKTGLSRFREVGKQAQLLLINYVGRFCTDFFIDLEGVVLYISG